MWASHVPETGRIDVIEWPDPVPTRPGEFVVEMLWASICGSDLHAIYEGRLHPEGALKPGYPGHEGLGADLVVDAVGTNAIRNECLDQVTRLGVVGLYGLSTPQVEPLNTHQAFHKCARVQFSVAAQSEPGLLSFREALRRIAEDGVRVDYCVGPTYDLRDVAEATRCAAEQGHGDVKITVRLGQDTRPR